jgi:small-conductance mechanosensitive channel
VPLQSCRIPAERSPRAAWLAVLAGFGWLVLGWPLLAASLEAAAVSKDLGPIGQPDGPPPRLDNQVSPAQATTPPTADPPASPKKGIGSELQLQGLTLAEKVSLLQRLIQTNKEELRKLQEQREAFRSDDSAQREFETLDNLYKDKSKQLQEAREANDAELIEKLAAETAELRKPRQLAKERFDLELRERKAINERIALLEATIQQDEERLQVLLGNQDEPPPQPRRTPDGKPAESPAADQPPRTGAPPPGTDEPTKPEAPPGEPAATGPLGLPGLPAAKSAKPEDRSGPDDGGEPAKRRPDRPPTKELVKAEEQVKKKAEEVTEHERRSQLVEERLGSVDRSLKLEQDLLETARLRAANARASRDLASRQLQAKSAQGAPAAELNLLRDRIQESDDRLQNALSEVKRREERIEQLSEERALFLEAQRQIRARADAAKRELERAQGQVDQLQNPLSPDNLKSYAIRRGPPILAILATMFLLEWLMARLSQRIIRLVASRGSRGSKAERENRARTLVSVFHNAATLVIVVGGSLLIFDQAGVPVAPLLGGAAVFGLAVAFGAQNLIRDYFYGFMILLENQFKLNDVVRIGEHSGQVEQVTLRMTALRDLEGNLHFLPNGAITSVVNMTHGWSRALFDIGVGYGEDVDRVMDVIVELGREMRRDPDFRPLILEDLTMLGVDAFDQSAIVIKFFIKTLPLQQWSVRREFLRRLKKRFDELGIEIPFPHRTLVLRGDPADRFEVLSRSVRERRIEESRGE